MSLESTQGNAVWSYVDATIEAVESRLDRRLAPDTEDAALVTDEQFRRLAAGMEDGGLALRVASGEGNRRRIYYRNHQETGAARASHGERDQTLVQADHRAVVAADAGSPSTSIA